LVKNEKFYTTYLIITDNYIFKKSPIIFDKSLHFKYNTIAKEIYYLN